MDSSSALLAFAALVVASMLLAATARVGLLLVVGILAWSLGSAWYAPLPPGVGAIAGSLFIVAAIARASIRDGRRFSEARIIWFPVVASLTGLALSPFATSGATVQSNALQVLMMALVVIVAVRTIPRDEAMSSYLAATSILVGASLALWVVGVSDPDGKERYSGVTSNPNHLGILVFLWVALSFEKKRAAFLTLPVGLFLVFLSGSRGSTLALVAGASAALWVGRSDTHKQGPPGVLQRGSLVVAILCTTAYAAAQVRQSSVAGPTSPIFRADDSGRVDAASHSWALFMERPWTGFGFGELNVGAFTAPHVWPVAMALQMGVVGLVLFVVLVVGLLRTPWRHSPALAALVFSAIVSWLTESWALGAGAMTTGLFWLSLGALTGTQRKPNSEPPSHMGRLARVNGDLPRQRG